MKYYFTIIFILMFALNVFSQSENSKIVNDKQDTIFPEDTSLSYKCQIEMKGFGIYLITNQMSFQEYFKCEGSLKFDFNKKIIIYYCYRSTTGINPPVTKLKIFKDEFGNDIVYFDVSPKVNIRSGVQIINKLYIINKPDLDKTVFMINNRYGRIFTFKYEPNKSYIKYPIR